MNEQLHDHGLFETEDSAKTYMRRIGGNGFRQLVSNTAPIDPERIGKWQVYLDIPNPRDKP